MPVVFQDFRRNVRLRKVGDWIAARLEKQEHVLAICDPSTAEADAHAPPQRLGIEKSFGQPLGRQKPADSSRR
jgi:hypothetical protein